MQYLITSFAEHNIGTRRARIRGRIIRSLRSIGEGAPSSADEWPPVRHSIRVGPTSLNIVPKLEETHERSRNLGLSWLLVREEHPGEELVPTSVVPAYIVLEEVHYSLELFV